MFLHLSVIHSVHRGDGGGGHPPDPEADPPPPVETAIEAGGTHLTGMRSCVLCIYYVRFGQQ